ncbi:hypothetical protein [Streptomyces sp. NBC_00448]|uniref:hypothetical protein n=1 Tax=Streptomyces sp. NBC_00448 TaxID=2903652 RepID=UPI003FA70EE2
MALWSIALVGSTPIGAPIIGAVSQGLDPRVGVALGALSCLAAAAVGRTPRAQRPPRGAAATMTAPAPTRRPWRR